MNSEKTKNATIHYIMILYVSFSKIELKHKKQECVPSTWMPHSRFQDVVFKTFIAQSPFYYSLFQ